MADLFLESLESIKFQRCLARASMSLRLVVRDRLVSPMLDRINAGKFYNGGAVSEMEEASDSGISGGKTNNINISVNIEKGSVKSENSESKGDDEKEKSEGSSLAEKIKEQILSVIIEEQRPGGVLED